MLVRTESNKAFTLVELMVSVGIFVLMTVLLIVKFGNFNQGVLLTNTAYDIALIMRTAQTFGLSVSNAAQDSGTSEFKYPYGVNVSTISSAPGANDSVKNRVILFADSNPATTPPGPDGAYSSAAGAFDIPKQVYNLTRGAYVSSICIGASESDCPEINPVNNATNVSITFKRPDPKSLICGVSTGCSGNTFSKFAKITISGSDGSQRYITVRENGQISILQ
jgi:type II secretory pathway pseudopilin PulG